MLTAAAVPSWATTAGATTSQAAGTRLAQRSGRVASVMATTAMAATMGPAILWLVLAAPP